MDDQNNQNQGGYVGGFSFGTGPANGSSTGANPMGSAQPVQPMPQPVYGQPAPTYAQPSPVYNQPAPTYAQPTSAQPYQSPMPQPMPQAGAVAPMGGGMMGDDQAAGGQAPFDPNYHFGDRMKNFTTTIKCPPHSLNFNEDQFINLLAGSISLSKDEKKKIVESIPKLRQEQVDELIRIFEEERTKFIELSSKHGAQLKKLEDQHAADWRDLEVEQKATAQKQDEQNKADEIRKQLGI